jgi:hypothetical protein
MTETELEKRNAELSGPLISAGFTVPVFAELYNDLTPNQKGMIRAYMAERRVNPHEVVALCCRFLAELEGGENAV